MSEAHPQAEKADTDGGEQDELTKDEFFDRLKIEGVTLDRSFYMPHGTGRQRRYFKYDPGDIKGFDAVRDDDGDIEAQHVAAHEQTFTEKVDKGHMEEVVFPKLRDGFGSFGLIRVESRADEGGQTNRPSENEYEPMDDEEVLETIRANYDEHGFFAENDDGDTKVVSLAHPEARLMGYITGSHVGSLPSESLSTVDDYRNAVYQALGGDLTEDDEADPIVDFGSPDDVPIMTDDMMETFRESGNKIVQDEETKKRISNQVKARWEDGEYDHLRKADDEDDEDDDDEGNDDEDTTDDE